MRSTVRNVPLCRDCGLASEGIASVVRGWLLGAEMERFSRALDATYEALPGETGTALPLMLRSACCDGLNVARVVTGLSMAVPDGLPEGSCGAGDALAKGCASTPANLAVP